MIIFKKSIYGLCFASMDSIKWFINQIKEAIMGDCCKKDIFCPCEIFTDDEGNHGALPVYQTKLAACADVCLPKQVIINPGPCKIDLLIGFDIPEDMKIMMYPRSSLLIKNGLIQPTSIIDADYSHKHVHVPFYNPGTKPVILERGERVAQIECVPRYDNRQWGRKDEERTGGFGSTGK